MNYDLNIIYEELDNLSNRSASLSSIIVFAAFFSIVGVYFLLTTVFRMEPLGSEDQTKYKTGNIININIDNSKEVIGKDTTVQIQSKI